MKTLEYLDQLRESKGLTVYQLSKLSDVPLSTLYSAFERKKGASDETITALAKVFGMELWELQKAVSEANND